MSEYCEICHSETCEHQDRSCPCGCGDGKYGKCVYEGAYANLVVFSAEARRITIEQQARELANTTAADMRCSLQFVDDLAVLHRALELVQDTGSGYGSGKTAARMIKSAIRRAEMPKGATK